MLELKIKSLVTIKRIQFELNKQTPHSPTIAMRVPMPQHIITSIVNYCEEQLGVGIVEKESPKKDISDIALKENPFAKESYPKGARYSLVKKDKIVE